ncbi:alpha/beta hydrolase [Hahella aquimaris]|uniref:alpha/beta fold hydrolase n=1 Tax=Hahella sp. HNIBRBA332 TaxID=3015983 RepID=UPI00273A8BF9|nr:alpha/beta hydrolase [Hahella sp. HNIBRBA332]WLQ13036.1 alpha/beta hydrolase [Hahella sp. HNIBRBA332]
MNMPWRRNVSPLPATGALNLLQLPGQRTLAYGEWGDPAGAPVFYAHGAPGSRLEGAFFHEAACAAGLRWIVVDRPGMGASSLADNYTLLDYPRDVSAVADALGIDQFAVAGWSSGGAYALTCAFEIPKRIAFVAVMASYTNFGEMSAAKDLLWRNEQRGPKIAEVSTGLFRTLLSLLRLTERCSPKLYLKFIESSSTEQDLVLLRDAGILERFMDNQHEAFNQGVQGVMLDLLAQYRHWGFSLSEIRLPTHIYQGVKDRFVPWRFAQHLADNLPLADLRMITDAGHMFPLEADFQRELMSAIRRHLVMSEASDARKQA